MLAIPRGEYIEKRLGNLLNNGAEHRINRNDRRQFEAPGSSTAGTNGGAPPLQYSLAETFGIVLPGFRKLDDLACYDFIGNVAAINKPKRYRCHFICEAHDSDGLWVK